MDFLTLTIGKQKNIALIAHDSKKHEMIEWCEANKEILKGHFLCGTGTTARMITEATGLPVKGYNSGPLGGDQQIGAKIVEGRIDFVVFFSDPLTAQPHDPDVKALIDTYNEFTGKHAEPFAMGGGTYARNFARAVSFGPEETGLELPAWGGQMHGPNECANEEQLKQALKIYIVAILRLNELEL